MSKIRRRIPNGHHRVMFMDYITESTLEIRGAKLNTEDLDIVLEEIHNHFQWGIFLEDIYWNADYKCIEIELGT